VTNRRQKPTHVNSLNQLQGGAKKRKEEQKKIEFLNHQLQRSSPSGTFGAGRRGRKKKKEKGREENRPKRSEPLALKRREEENQKQTKTKRQRTVGNLRNRTKKLRALGFQKGDGKRGGKKSL